MYIQAYLVNIAQKNELNDTRKLNLTYNAISLILSRFWLINIKKGILHLEITNIN